MNQDKEIKELRKSIKNYMNRIFELREEINFLKDDNEELQSQLDIIVRSY